MDTRQAFEAWAGNDFCLDLNLDGTYETWRTDCAWLAWQAATLAERERLAAFVEGPCGGMQMADRNELRQVAAAIRSPDGGAGWIGGVFYGKG